VIGGLVGGADRAARGVPERYLAEALAVADRGVADGQGRAVRAEGQGSTPKSGFLKTAAYRRVAIFHK